MRLWAEVGINIVARAEASCFAFVRTAFSKVRSNPKGQSFYRSPGARGWGGGEGVVEANILFHMVMVHIEILCPWGEKLGE